MKRNIITNSQSTFFEFEDMKEYSIHYQLGMNEAKRKMLFDELLENLETAKNIDEKKSLCRIYVYETRDIDERIREIRQLILRK